VKVGIIGAGRIGGNAAKLLAAAGHEVLLSYSRAPERLTALADEIGEAASVGSVAEAAAFGPVVLFSVPWSRIDEVIAETGGLDEKVVIDTTNQYAAGGLEELPAARTAAQVNAARAPGARWAKAFNTLTSGFLAAAAGRTGEDRVAVFYCCEDEDACRIVDGLIEDAGFAAVRIGGLADAAPMEAPRRDGAVYGEEYHRDDAVAYVEALRAGASLPGPSVAG
jgi:8-hydroxy-5-deazaflavin:NADPH oxidoreductase